eukprot:4746880-Pleurochrysis_carterae.AAC.1
MGGWGSAGRGMRRWDRRRPTPPGAPRRRGRRPPRRLALFPEGRDSVPPGRGLRVWAGAGSAERRAGGL